MKYIEVPDFHYSPAWADFSVQMGHLVAKAARDNNVDFIACPGDWFDAPIYASNKGGLDTAKAIMAEWLNVCPVVAVEGTPSHDAPGCYGIFREMAGFTLMEPGKVYHYVKGLGRIFQVNPGKAPEDPDAILFGVPELSKKNIQSRLNLPAEQANAAAEQLFRDYVKQFIAPNRARFPDIPAIGLFHGNLTDSRRENESDIILKSSDILVHTEDLLPANLDRWSCGHIHTPRESKVINAGYSGYPGVDRNPWGKCDFLPAMNLIELPVSGGCNASRIAYGSPMRRKVKSVTDTTGDPNVAWWVETEDTNAVLPEGLHPWSRLTVTETRKETRRIDEAGSDKPRSLWDLFKLIDPDVATELKAKVDEITETVKPVEIEEKHVAVTSVEIAGCILFKGRKVKFDMSNLAEGLTLITGQNGDGKSSLLSFCHPYPVIIGKDTKSGRDSAIKDFFSGRESYIKKTVIKNGVAHEHLITIKAAHTQSPKTECYLTIDGQPQLDKGSFEEMMHACEIEYGAVEDYRITTFCEQPNQASSNMAGLMTAKPIDARNIVQAIAGVDRERERRYALDRVNECQSKAENLILRADAKAEMLSGEDFPALINEAERLKVGSEETVIALHKEGKALAGVVEQMEADNKENERRVRLFAEIADGQKKMEDLEKKVSTLASNVLLIKQDDEAVAANRETEAIEARNRDGKLAYDRSVMEKQAYDKIKDELAEASKLAANLCELKEKQAATRAASDAATHIRELESVISGKRKVIAELDRPCEHCGKLSSTASSEISKINIEIESLETALATYREVPQNIEAPFDIDSQVALAMMAADSVKELSAKLAGMNEVTVNEFTPEPVSEHKPVLDDFRRQVIQDEIATARAAGENISTIKESISLKTKEAESITVPADISERLRIEKTHLDTMRGEFTDMKVNLETRTAELAALIKQRDDNEALREEITRLREDAEATGVDSWQYIAGMLAANKIPALELDMFLGVIDSEATAAIDPFLEGRYSIETVTQEMGKKGLVDRFDIIVHDREDGGELSLFSYNPGHKAFFSDAYIKALILQRNNRLRRSYSPVIFDEADSPIKESRIGMYYDINQSYYQAHAANVLVVSQKDSAVNYMVNVVDVNEFKED